MDNEIEKRLKKLTLLSLLYDLSETAEERDFYNQKYCEVSQWLEERAISFRWSRETGRYEEKQP